MVMFKKILCPIDFSEASRQTLQYAKALAETFESELSLLHVSPNISEAYTALMPDFPTFGLQKEDDLVSQFSGFADDWAGKLKKVIRTGMPDTEILKYAERDQSDLIIIGAKGHSNFERLLLGSIGEKVIRNSHRPVLTVHSKPRGLRINKILAPIDFSPLSYAVLPTVATLAEKFKAEINLLHIVEMGHHINTKGQVKEYNYFERVKERLEEQWKLPKEFDQIEIKKFVRHHVGSAGYGILEFAQDWDIDLIVMATHGRSGLNKVFMGSVAEKVIRIAPCPVLSIRSQTKSSLNKNQKEQRQYIARII